MENEIKVGEYVRDKDGYIIKVGEYVRDKDGYIIKVNEIQNYTEQEDVWFEENFLEGIWKSKIVKHSTNLIDLIEEGDYVNGYKVNNIEKGKLIIGDTTQVIEQIVENDEIETVVTKEMLESITYKVKE